MLITVSTAGEELFWGAHSHWWRNTIYFGGIWIFWHPWWRWQVGL